VNNLSDLGDAASALGNLLPAQTGNTGKVLTTDGTSASWGDSGRSSSGDADLVQLSDGSGAFTSIAGLGWDSANVNLTIPGGITLSPATGATIRGVTELVLKQTGDTFGPCALHLQNRNGVSGALFDATGSLIDLIDFVFKTNGSQKNIRLENRAGQGVGVGLPAFLIGGNTAFGGALQIGDDYSAFGTHVYVGRYASDPGTMFTAETADSGKVAMAAKAASGQTANLHEWRDSSDAVMSSVSENGYLTTRKNAEPAASELGNGEATYWLDPTPGAAKFNVIAKDSNGAVVRGSVALA
jgi:hypothetical protein